MRNKNPNRSHLQNPEMKSNSKSVPILAAACAILSCMSGASQAAVVLADFTGGTWPVQGWGVASLSTTMDPSPGSGEWGSVAVSQYYGQMTIPSWATGNLTVANLNSNSKLEFDLILPSAGWLSGNINIDLGIYIDPTNDSVNNGTDYGPAGASFNVSSSKDQILHFAIDYSAAGILPDAIGGGPDINLNINPGYDWMWDTGGNPSGVPYTDQSFYIDNITLTSVPEPSAAAVFGAMGVMALLRRRRF
jgi:hypothetical protein